MHLDPTRRGTTAALLTIAALLATAPWAVAGTPDAPEITDPAGDATHVEFGHQEPTLDVTKVWLAWEAGALTVNLEIPSAEALGPDATEDPMDEGAYYDVYWTYGDADYVARAVAADGEVAYQAGQSMRIERVLVWDMDDDIHGDLAAQTGDVALGTPATITIRVDPAAVGDPGPGDTLEDVAFSTYVDHHPPAGPEQHHPGHVDLNDAAGGNFTIPAQHDASSDGDGADTDTAGSDDERTIPGAGAIGALGGLVAALAAVALRRRR